MLSHEENPTPASLDGARQPVHLLGGLPTDGVARGFEQIRDVVSVQSFAAFIGSALKDWPNSFVLLPPHIEPSQIVEDWEGCNFLPERCGRGAHIGNVTTVVDSGFLADQLGTAESIAARGWGRSARDVRTVADITIGQIESATHILLVGSSTSSEKTRGLLGALNPTARRLALDTSSPDRLREFLTRPRKGACHGSATLSARVVPPWLDLLRGEDITTNSRGCFLYQRTRPFDPERFGNWIAQPQRNLVRGKGNIWLANRPENSYGYSCAGSVHRVFATGRWWADHAPSAWPTCESARQRLLERWHPRFGDRRQEIAFAGIDRVPEEIAAQLDACLLSEEEALETVEETTWGSGADGSPPIGLH